MLAVAVAVAVPVAVPVETAVNFFGVWGRSYILARDCKPPHPPLRRERESKEGVSGGSDRELPPLTRVFLLGYDGDVGGGRSGGGGVWWWW